MSDIDLAITRSKKLERLLESRLRASGRGLHEKVSSVEGRLPDALVRKLRKIATIRNKIVHEESYAKIDDRRDFLRTCDEAERELRSLGGGGGRGGAGTIRTIAVVFVLIVLAAIIAWYVWRR